MGLNKWGYMKMIDVCKTKLLLMSIKLCVMLRKLYVFDLVIVKKA